MKRIVAREFLLVVGWLILCILVGMFGWIRNSWIEHRIDSLGRIYENQSHTQDSLAHYVVPRHLDFLDLFEPQFVRNHYDVFLLSPFWTMDPYFTGVSSGPILGHVVDNPFEEFGGVAVVPSPSQKYNRRLLLCVAKALDNQGYLTPDRTLKLAAACGYSIRDYAGVEQELRNATRHHENGWRSPIDAQEVYISFPKSIGPVSWIDALYQRGVPKEEMSKLIKTTRSDTSIAPNLLIAFRSLLCDTVPNAHLRNGFNYLKEQHALRCTFDELLYTLQDNAVPPSEDALAAFMVQKATLDELYEKQSYARASLWSESKQWNVLKWVAVIMFVLVWPLRLLVLGTQWALRTLRT